MKIASFFAGAGGLDLGFKKAGFEIVWANEYATANSVKLVYCLCINANLYIENKVPPIDLFLKHLKMKKRRIN